ncbi:NUDIX domain-containing protein [Homoserinimonas aerilata]|uniref:NUDIX domain-containing protein n=1 Tax=Homoserinimonas aerilata TaxID=1162970 RepID=A0A542YHN3_9MICO|nr:CoA pyrophosphatase [Homoserinimonas aerilata]TQL47596.1 NUDIX domain-containing protein [Homoserinimonas aerilata]
MSSTHRRDLDELASRARDGRFTPLAGPHAYDPVAAEGYRQSGVLALFTPGSGQDVDLFLVQRSPLLRDHPGQIALPGGRIEPSDDGPIAAALRETHEETGIRPDRVTVLGALPPVLVPVSNFVVTPVIGWADDAIAADSIVPGEVLHTLRVSVDTMLDDSARAMVEMGGFRSHGFRLPTGWVWGFTGNLLAHLFEQLGWARPWDTQRVYRMTLDEAHGRSLITPED